MATPAVLRRVHAPFARHVAFASKPSPLRPCRTLRTTRCLNDAAAAQQPPPSPPPLRPAAKPRRSLRVYIYAAACLAVGLTAGQFVRAVIVPPPLPLPDTEDDELSKARARKELDALPLVQELRACRDEWLEYEAHMAAAPVERAASMTAGAMAGARGVGVQRVFWHREERRLISVLFIGGGLSGWPGVTHGGVLATLLQEAFETVANGPEVLPGVGGHELAGFRIDYRKPTTANMIYVIRAEVDEARAQEAGRVMVKGGIENALSGIISAQATGTCEAGMMQRAKEEAKSTGQIIGRWFGW